MPGEPVRISLFKANISAQPIVFTYPTTQRYDFSVASQVGEVWRWSADKVFVQYVDNVTMVPGETKSYVETWLQVDASGRPVVPGVYRVTGWNTMQGFEAFPAPSVFITVTSGSAIPRWLF